MRKGLAFGAFDPVHIGHIFLFENAKKHCDYLVVLAMTDNQIKSRKGYTPRFTLDERMLGLSRIESVDEVSCYEGGKKGYVQRYRPDFIFVGDDWTPETFDGEGLGVEVIYLQRTKGVSGTQLR